MADFYCWVCSDETTEVHHCEHMVRCPPCFESTRCPDCNADERDDAEAEAADRVRRDR